MLRKHLYNIIFQKQVLSGGSVYKREAPPRAREERSLLRFLAEREQTSAQGH